MNPMMMAMYGMYGGMPGMGGMCGMGGACGTSGMGAMYGNPFMGAMGGGLGSFSSPRYAGLNLPAGVFVPDIYAPDLYLQCHPPAFGNLCTEINNTFGRPELIQSFANVGYLADAISMQASTRAVPMPWTYYM